MGPGKLTRSTILVLELVLNHNNTTTIEEITVNENLFYETLPSKMIMVIAYSLYYPPPQAHCPLYLVSVSSMSAGDVLASGKMHGKDTALSEFSYIITSAQ